MRSFSVSLVAAVAAAGFVWPLADQLHAADWRVLPAGERPKDVRLQPLKELSDYFPFTPSASPEAWAARREQVRRQMLVSLGLWPLPERTALKAVRHSPIDRGDYTVEAVFFESMPGFFVTGNLYLPKEAPKGGMPIVLCPYGHWNNGRFLENPPAEVQKLISSGAEQFDDAAHSPLQARCVHLARMGAAVFHYDMIGRADCTQIGEEIAHGFKKQRPEMISTERWGLFSPQAESQAQSIMGLQTWNSMRAVDFMETLPGVVKERVGVTGASGGATQTMILAALDPRVTAAFPAVMVSTAMQGGCTCENASGLRIGTGNVEFAAMFAPRPMGMTAANDWTKEMETKGFPELKKHWALLGAPDKVGLTANIQFPHNYNSLSRAAMYELFGHHLLGLPEGTKAPPERDFKRLTKEEMTVWKAGHAAPPGAPDFERDLLQWWHRDAQKQLGSARALRELGAPAMAAVIGRTYADAGEVSSELKDEVDKGDYLLMTALVQNATYGESLPALYLHPKSWNGTTVLWLDERGKAGLLGPDGEPRPEARALVAAGVSVMGVDLLYQGEFLPAGEKFTQAPLSKNPREAAAFTFGYNPSVLARRVHDVLSARKLVATSKHQTKRFGVIALGQTGPIAAAARAVAPEQFDAAAIETGGFRFMKVNDLRDPMFLPAGAKYGDLPGMLALGGPKPLLLLGEASLPALLSERREGAPAAEIAGAGEAAKAAEWIIGRLK